MQGFAVRPRAQLLQQVRYRSALGCGGSGCSTAKDTKELELVVSCRKTLPPMPVQPSALVCAFQAELSVASWCADVQKTHDCGWEGQAENAHGGQPGPAAPSGSCWPGTQPPSGAMRPCLRHRQSLSMNVRGLVSTRELAEGQHMHMCVSEDTSAFGSTACMTCQLASQVVTPMAAQKMSELLQQHMAGLQISGAARLPGAAAGSGWPGWAGWRQRCCHPLPAQRPECPVPRPAEGRTPAAAAEAFEK